LNHELSNVYKNTEKTYSNQIIKEGSADNLFKQGEVKMDVVYKRCCGIDVHKKKIVSCFMTDKKREIKEFGTMTRDIKEMAEWLKENKCEIVAMESTGSYWNPLYNILELLGVKIIVVNASHMKTVPGKKTDKKDAEWIAELLRHGLLKASYIPDREQRELREISRYRKSLVEEMSREINRLSKMLEGANIKLGSVVSNINGKNSRRVLDVLLNKKVTNESIAAVLDGSMKCKF